MLLLDYPLLTIAIFCFVMVMVMVMVFIGDGFVIGPGISVIPILAGGAVLLLLVAVGLFIFYRKRRRRLKRRDTLIHNEEGLSDIERSFDHDDTAVFDEISETLEPQLSDETDSCTILERRKLFLNMDWTIV